MPDFEAIFGKNMTKDFAEILRLIIYVILDGNALVFLMFIYHLC